MKGEVKYMSNCNINNCITEFPNDFIKWFNGFMLEEYHCVSVLDVKNFLGIIPNYIDAKLGWIKPININDFVDVKRNGNIYWRLNLPEPNRI